MTLKEQPLINATGRVGPIWSPANPWLAGVLGTLACGFFGMLVLFFQAFGRGAVYPKDLLDPLRLGIFIGFGLSGCGFLYLVAKAIRGDGEWSTLGPFIFAGMLTIAVIVMLDHYFVDDLRVFLTDREPLMGRQ